MKKTIAVINGKCSGETRDGVFKFMKDPSKRYLLLNLEKGTTVDFHEIDIKYSPKTRISAYLFGV